MPFFISFCRSRSSLVFLLGAGVSATLAASALAGDKIEFSPAADTLAMPAVDHAESEPADASPFSLRSPAPDEGMLFTLMPPPVAPPSRRKSDPNLRNAKGGSGTDQEKSGQNGSDEKSDWDTSATEYSSKPASNYFNGMKAWDTSGNPDGLGRGTDKLDARYVQTDARQGSLNSPERRDGQNDTRLGLTGNKAWASRQEDASASGAKTSLADALKQPNKLLSGANSSISKSLFSAPGAGSAWESSPLIPSDQSLFSLHNTTDPGYKAYKDSSGRALPGRSSPRLDEGITGGSSVPSAWANLPGYGFPSPDPAPAYRPPLSPVPAVAPQRQQSGMSLPMPRKPGSVFNN